MVSKRRRATAVKVLQLATAPKSASIDFAEALWKAEKQKPGRLKDIATETGMSLRKAYYLFELWDKFADLKVKRELLVDVGWTKLAIVAKHLQPGMELAFLDLAQRNTAKELPAILLGGSQDLDKARSVQLRLTPTQYKTFEAVLRKFGAKSAKNGHGLVNKERAIMRIVNKMQAAGQ